MNGKIVAYLQVMSAMVIVGSSVVVGKILVQDIPIFIASELRFMIASIIFLLLLMKKERFPSIHKKQLLILFFQAFCGVFLFNIFMLYGLKWTTAMEAGIITSTLPVVIGFVSFIFFKETLTRTKGLGISFAVLGVLFINLFSDELGNKSSFIGNFLIFGAVIGETLFMTLGKRLSNQLSPLTISTMMSVFALLMFLPFSIYEARNFNLLTIDFVGWINILYFGVVVTVVAFLLMYQGISKIPASSAGVLTSVLPMSSVILSFFILKEEFLVTHLIGMIFVLLAIVFISREPASKESAS